MTTKDERIAELEAVLAKSTVIEQISRELNVVSTEDELLQVLIQSALGKGLGAATLFYIDLDEAGEPEWAEIVAVWSSTGKTGVPIGTRFYIQEFPFSYVWLSSPDEPTLVVDAHTDERVSDSLRQIWDQTNARRVASMPLLQSGRWVGMLGLQWGEPHQFSPQEVELYRALMKLVPTAVENQRLIANLERMVEARTTELQVSLDRERLLMENIPQKIFFKDMEFVYVSCNHLYAEDLGIDTGEIRGKTDYDFYPSDLADKYRADDRRIVETGQTEQLEETYQVGDKESMVSTVKAPVRDADGQIIGLLGMFKDITKRKQAEAEYKRLQQELVEAHQRAIQELSTPVIPIMERIIVMPLVGSIDSMRARAITRALLAGISEQRAKVVILDITGVLIVDSGVATHLNKTIQAARLKGAQTIITGISDAVAETIVDLGIDWSDITTLSDLQTGLKVALSSLGIKLTK